jgi:TonB family protein
MSDTLVNEGTGGVPPERRAGARQLLSSLVYLDIGADNGGIVVNVSEGGLAIQAVSPIENHSALKLRILPQGRQSRIETEARVAWLGQGHKQAGLCFLGMPADKRVQIQEWIQSAGVPSSCQVPRAAENENPPLPNATEPLAKQGRSAARTDKWHTILAELETSRAAQHAQTAPVETSARDSKELRGWVRITPPKPELVSGHSGRLSRSMPGSRITETPPESPTYQQSGPPAMIEKAYTIEAENHASANSDLRVVPDAGPVLVRSASQSSTVAPTSASSPEIPADLPSIAARPSSDLSSFSKEPQLTTENPSATRTNWGRIAALFIVLGTIFFTVGIGVGRWGRRTHPSTSATLEPTKAVPASKPSTKTGLENKPTEPSAAALKQRRRTKTPPARLIAKATARKRNNVPVATPPVVVAVEQNLQTVPEEIPPAPPLAKPLNSSPPPSPVPAIDQVAAESSRPAMIDGRVLRPTDRYNPCHLTYRVEPVYPLEAERQGIEGAVRIHQVIGPDGTVQSVKLLSGPPPLVPAALDAARYWRYLPALLNGKPIATEQDVEIDFRLPQSSKQ